MTFWTWGRSLRLGFVATLGCGHPRQRHRAGTHQFADPEGDLEGTDKREDGRSAPRELDDRLVGQLGDHNRLVARTHVAELGETLRGDVHLAERQFVRDAVPD